MYSLTRAETQSEFQLEITTSTEGKYQEKYFTLTDFTTC